MRHIFSCVLNNVISQTHSVSLEGLSDQHTGWHKRQLFWLIFRKCSVQISTEKRKSWLRNRTSLFQNTAVPRFVVGYRRFGTTCRSHIKGSSTQRRITAWFWKMGMMLSRNISDHLQTRAPQCPGTAKTSTIPRRNAKISHWLPCNIHKNNAAVPARVARIISSFVYFPFPVLWQNFYNVNQQNVQICYNYSNI